MDRYETPAAFRAALEDRLKQRAPDHSTLDRFRRQVVFDRMLARLESETPGQWVVKGGTAMEIRLPGRARRTKDLDMATRQDTTDGLELHADLVRALEPDPFEDWFEFRVADPQQIADDEAGRPGWRFPVESRLAGRTFAKVRMDIVARMDEISATERATLPSLLQFAGLSPVEVEIVDQKQHFAEKLHAYSKDYGDRPNTRVRDIVDMVLLIEDGLQPDADLYASVDHVFDVRDTHQVPVEFPDPPPAWDERYEELAQDLDISPKTLDVAVPTVRSFWAAAVAAKKEKKE